MKPSFVILVLALSGHVMSQDTVPIVAPSPASSGLFSSLTGFLPSFPSLPSLPTLPSLSVGPLPCVGLSTLSQGRCISSDSCASTGGSTDSGCITSDNVCCIPPLKCGSIVTSADAWITNNEYPNTTVMSQNCVYTINKASPVVSQLKIELDTLTLDGPTAVGECKNDRLIVEGITGVNIFPICGVSSKSHIILPFNGVSVNLRVVVSNTNGIQRKWRIHLTQIAHNALTIAPAGCTQLYSEDGTLSSLNPGVGGLKYAICFQKKPGTCGLRLDMSSLLKSQIVPQPTLNQIPQPTITRLSKRQVDVTAANAIGVNVPVLPTNVFLPSIVKTNVETAANGDQKATADLFNLQFLNNGLRIGKEVLVQNPPPTPAQPLAPAQPTPAPLPVLVQKIVEQKPMTPHYYGGRYYPHSNPSPVYSAPLPAPVPQKAIIEKAVILPEPSTPLLQSNLVLGSGINGLLGVNNNLTATLENPLLKPLPLLPAPVLPVLPNLTLPNLLKPVVVQTTQPGAGNGVGVSATVNAGLGSTLATGVRARRQDNHIPQMCHQTMFAAPKTIVCLENYSGATEIVLNAASPFEIIYVEAATTLVGGSKWNIPFTFIPC